MKNKNFYLLSIFQYVVYQKPGEIMEVLILIKLTARFDWCELTFKLGFNAQKIVEIVDLCINFFK